MQPLTNAGVPAECLGRHHGEQRVQQHRVAGRRAWRLLPLWRTRIGAGVCVETLFPRFGAGAARCTDSGTDHAMWRADGSGRIAVAKATAKGLTRKHIGNELRAGGTEHLMLKLIK